jgi:PPOX class probable F420-dependent enzyme
VVVAVTGGTGTLGTCVVRELADRGHAVRQLSRRADREIPGSVHYPVDLTTGAGLEEALGAVEVVIDAANSMSPRGAREVLVGGTERLTAAAHAAGVRHHVLCSIVGIEEVPYPYYRAKIDQERILTSGRTPWSIVRATQFHALVDMLFTLTARGRVLPAPDFELQPVDARTVARALADAAESPPSKARLEIAGPEVLRTRELAYQWRRSTGRRALVVPLPIAGRTGRALQRGALTAPSAAALGTVTFEQWLEARGRGATGPRQPARPGARPRPGRRLPGGRSGAHVSVLLQRAVTRALPSPGDSGRRPNELGDTPYTLLTTFRRDGTPVAVPVWAALSRGRLYVRSERATGKVKRLVRDGRAEVAPCNAFGRALAPGTPARGRVLPAEEEATAERALSSRYGPLREAFERSVDLMRVEMCYLELTLAPPAP